MQINEQPVSTLYSLERFFENKVHNVTLSTANLACNCSYPIVRASGINVIISMIISDATSHQDSMGGPFFRVINRGCDS